MKIILKILLLPIALLCFVISMLIGMLGSIAQGIIGLLTGISTIFFLVSIFGNLGAVMIVLWGVITLLLGFATVFVEAIPAFFSQLSSKIFDL